MKTKIIYISGNEVFEMSEIRAAFDEVRSALGLDNDTVLFGVPVDSDNALESAETIDMPRAKAVCETTEEDFTVQAVETPQIHSQTAAEPTVCEEIVTVATDNAPEINDIADTTDTINQDTEEKFIPILSVLAVNQNTEPESDVTADFTNTEIHEEIIATEQATPTEESVTANSGHNDDVNINTVDDAAQVIQNIEKISIGDMVDEAPVAHEEKTLEQLLEIMTPLREDIEHSTQNFLDDDTPETFDMDTNDTDATLAQLASEFAENEENIVTTSAKAEPQGKIGKLKNILPFKKAKRDDGGLMGDLFGWAGIAANDDDFTMPGFFTGAKKQGA